VACAHPSGTASSPLRPTVVIPIPRWGRCHSTCWFLLFMAPVSDGTLVGVHPTQLFNDSGLREQALIIIRQPDSLILATKLRNAFSALEVNNLGHVDIRVIHVVPHNLRPSAFAQNG
jgi:hypothetical protein